jgi:hypothetical protein
VDRTRRLFALALGLGALTLLPAAGAQAATATPAALSFSSSVGVASAPQLVIYSVSAADSSSAHVIRVGINGATFESHPFTQTNNCDSLPASGSGQCAVSVTFTPNSAGTGPHQSPTTHQSLLFLPRNSNDGQTPFATADLTGVATSNGGKGKKCHKKGKKASAAKKCKSKKH